MTRRFPIALFVVLATFVLAAAASPDASAAGNWQWGAPGFSNLWTAAQRDNYLVTGHLADPLYNYYTPTWQGGTDPNYYTGVVDTGLRNTFSVNHDINANHGIPMLGYLDIFTPLLNTNELEVAAAASAVWTSITQSITSMWSSITSVFQTDYSSYQSSGSYNGGGYQDNGVFESFDFGSYSGGGGSSGGPRVHLEN